MDQHGQEEHLWRPMMTTLMNKVLDQIPKRIQATSFTKRVNLKTPQTLNPNPRHTPANNREIMQQDEED